MNKFLRWKRFSAYSNSKAVIIAGLLVVVALVTLVLTRAAVPTLSFEVESGKLSGGAKVQTLSNASGSSAVAFMASGTPGPAGSWYRPAKSATWQWQIDGGSKVQENLDVQMYDIDMQDAMPSVQSVTITWPAAGNYQATATWPKGVNAGIIDRLHAKGIKVVCYTDTGAFENYRPDASMFPGAWGSGNKVRVDSNNKPLPYTGPPMWSSIDVIGGKSEAANGSTFAGEFWLDQRQPAWQYWEPIIVSRFQLAKRIGCDGLEGDQNNAYGNDSTFGVKQADSLKLYQEMFYQQHLAGLVAIAKNGLEVVPQMLAGVSGDSAGWYKPDGYLNEECNNFSECSPNMTKAAQAGYWVGQVEYTENGSTTSFCAADNAAGFMGLLKHLDLGVYAHFCWSGQATP